jgi:hypothetical protein
MHEIGVDVGCVEIGASAHSAENRAQWFRAGEIAGVNFVSSDLEIAFVKALIAKATNFHRHHLRQFPRKKADVNARAAVNVRRIFICEKKDLQARGRIK